jgi:cytochrome P450
VRSGLRFLRAPTSFLASERERLGDTFVLDAFGLRLLFLFSPEGLKSLYALREEDASFTEATRSLLGLKLPPELTSGDMSMFHRLFGKERREGYLAHVEDAAHAAIDDLPATGELELFEHAKRLVHRIGFRSWAGPEAASPRHLETLVELFERLDPEQAFLRPSTAVVTIATRNAPERRALREVAAILRAIHRERLREGRSEDDMLEELHRLYRDRTEEERYGMVARDVMVLHLASLSNLYAAMGWTFVHVLGSPSYRARAPTDDAFLDSASEEAIRLAQRSITLRKVLRPVTLDDGKQRYSLERGAYVATMLSVTNTTAAPGLGAFDPAHYQKGALTAPVRAREEVSTFGHGAHSCPGRRFALAAIRIAVRTHLERLQMTPLFDTGEGAVKPRPEQIGAVARADVPCRVRFTRTPR